jgi:hypothetical protein
LFINNLLNILAMKKNNTKFFLVVLAVGMISIFFVKQLVTTVFEPEGLKEKISRFYPARQEQVNILEFFSYDPAINKFGFDCYEGNTRLTFEFETTNPSDLKLLDHPNFPQKTFANWRLMTIYALEHDTDGVHRNPIYFRDLPYKQKEVLWALKIFNNRLDSVLEKIK